MVLSATQHRVLTQEQLDFYNREGYLVIPGLLTPRDVAKIRDRFDEIGKAGKEIPGHWGPDTSPEAANDPLRRFPRVMMPHRFDAMIQEYLLDPRVLDVLRDLLDDEPLAAQSMFYYKPTGSRGQAFHQDDFYLKTQGGNCIAAWFAIDPSTPENGGLYIAPGTHRVDVACPEKADTAKSFTSELVHPPAGHDPIPATLQPGDALFFNGRVIHGSIANDHPTMWRRSLINHYIPSKAVATSHWYFPLLDKDGNVVDREHAPEGGPCGTVTPAKAYAP